jgi:hypothetical protein
VLSLGLALASVHAAQPAKKTDAEIKQLLIQESIAGYKGSCPCPYSTDKAGKTCGARSAYSKPGGASPLCYGKDVTAKMVDDYRKRTNQ